MTYDKDIKIANDRPSHDHKIVTDNIPESDPESIRKGTLLGGLCAKKYVKAIKDSELGGNMDENGEIMSQRAVLLSFAVVSGLEQFLDNGDYTSAAKTAFFDYLKSENPATYALASDNGALSFYYLAYRRGSETERRIGQTFAMLCSHDGDPIYQELGEALYCWFTEEVKKSIKSCNENMFKK